MNAKIVVVRRPHSVLVLFQLGLRSGLRFKVRVRVRVRIKVRVRVRVGVKD
jgi:hypothetical protein